MLSRPSLPDLYSDHSVPDHHLHNPAPYPIPRPLMGFNNPFPPALDPVDFRAFYPYTPNEVKHRKRTTSSQLKILEDIFKRDTKPNAHLRNELAGQLAMTPRGVQVWFQNRRAKEKSKVLKVKGALKDKSDNAKEEESLSPLSLKEDSLAPESPSEVGQGPTEHDAPDQSDASTQVSSPAIPSPPQLHVITDASDAAWQNSPVDPPPDSASLPIPPHTFPQNNDLYSQRRGSLPANAFLQPNQGSDISPLVDCFDPLARRRSVDASLQRLANNPYAYLARAKNGALFGPSYGVAPTGRYNHHHHHQQLSRMSRPHLPHHTSMPQNLAMRRSSMDSRAFHRFSPRTALSPSPSPLSPYHAIRASLPDQQLYAVTSRSIASPIPGPLPSPHFSFGDASTPSLTSPSSGDSERNSPDSLRSFTFRNDDHDEDDRTSAASYDPYSRFNSITSIATSESSVNSAYYSEIGASEHDYNADFGRRDSCASNGPFVGMMSGLDMNGHQTLTEPMPSTIGYPPHDEYGLSRSNAIQVVDRNEPSHDSAASFPSPASTISPGGGSPHVLDASQQSSSVPISHSSELAFALQSKTDQAQTNAQEPPHMTYVQSQSQQHSHSGGAMVAAAVVVPQASGSEVPNQEVYYYEQHQQQLEPQMALGNGPNISAEYGEQYSAMETNIITVQGQYAPSYTPLTSESYALGAAPDMGMNHHQMEYGQPPVTDMYTYQQGSGSLDNAVQNVKTFISYT
ncbi:hypothetical protein BDQ12DRAFT_717998 [Crucibulum laeve]|uniref:Homeobox domain-containing protein n=1 Tax=Crucibulum laeve TaxID=68775 RepID=A0A5C3MJK5_9AGAR|nr:hypothetical protein BDQ12DRAFT_717998 [Crucibulum laeve]